MHGDYEDRYFPALDAVEKSMTFDFRGKVPITADAVVLLGSPGMEPEGAAGLEVREVYDAYGFEPLETPAVEPVRPAGAIVSW